MNDAAFHWITIGLALLTFLGTLVVQARSASKMEGQTSQRLDTHDGEIKDIKVEQVRQWEVMGKHGEQISALYVKTKMTPGGQL